MYYLQFRNLMNNQRHQSPTISSSEENKKALIDSTKTLLEAIVKSTETFLWRRTWAKIKSFFGSHDADVQTYEQEESMKKQYQRLSSSDKTELVQAEIYEQDKNAPMASVIG